MLFQAQQILVCAYWGRCPKFILIGQSNPLLWSVLFDYWNWIPFRSPKDHGPFISKHLFYGDWWHNYSFGLNIGVCHPWWGQWFGWFGILQRYMDVVDVCRSSSFLSVRASSSEWCPQFFKFCITIFEKLHMSIEGKKEKKKNSLCTQFVYFSFSEL